MKIAICYPGQGSQFPNMGLDFNDFSQVYRDGISLLSEEYKLALLDEKINKTKYCQPLLLLNQIGILDTLKEIYKVEFDGTLGFSLGEYSAFYTANMLDKKDILNLVINRANIMDGVSSDYEMRIVMGLDLMTLEELSIKYDFLIANQNLENQILIAAKNFDSLVDILKDNGAKRILPINISGPFHTSEFKNASIEFASLIKSNYKPPTCDLYVNYTGKLYDGDFKNNCMMQMQSGVLWYKEITSMINDGYDTFIEIGSKSVVGNLIKKIDKSIRVITIESVEDIVKLEEIWEKQQS